MAEWRGVSEGQLQGLLANGVQSDCSAGAKPNFMHGRAISIILHVHAESFRAGKHNSF